MKTDYEVGTAVSGWPDMCPSVYRCDRGKKQSGAPHISYDLSPLCSFMLCFTYVIDLLVMETNRYYHQYLNRHNRTPNPLPHIMNPEMLLFYQLLYKWATAYATDSETVGQGQKNSSHLST
jgi:hypothetical protein